MARLENILQSQLQSSPVGINDEVFGFYHGSAFSVLSVESDE